MKTNKRLSKKSKLLILLLLAIGMVVYQLYNKVDKNLLGEEKQGENTVNALLTDQKLVYTKHAKCRMDCRNIDTSEVLYILQNGKTNWQKSNENDSPCPSYALEGNTEDGQHVRIVFADCDDATKVITTIDLENEYDCYCE